MLASLKLRSLASLSLCLLSTPALCHSVDTPPDLVTPQINPTTTTTEYPAVVEGVIDQFKLWQAGATIHGCFFDSSTAVRAGFANALSEWLEQANLKVDFGLAPDYRSCSGDLGSQIRVAFQPTGNWSYVGTDSIRVDLSQPSMNIQTGNSMGSTITDANAFHATALHELGHALSLQHEHQSPRANCDAEFDWPAVYSQFSNSYGWDRAKVDHNLRSMVKSRRLRTTEYDPNSIMHYHFGSWMFKAGERSPCYVGRNTTLSDLDIVAIRASYPTTAGGQLKLVNQRLSSSRELTESLQVSSETADDLTKAIEGIVTEAFPSAQIGIITGDKSPVINNTQTGGGDIKIIIE